MTCRSSSVYSIGTGRSSKTPAPARSSRRVRGGFAPSPWCTTLLYRAGDGERLDLGQYLGRLARPLFEAYGVDRERIHLTLQADAVSVAADTAIPCGLLVHEVLVNCVQHAFPTPHRGVVTITLRVAPAGQATLTIRDTGIGWPGHGAVGAAEGFGLHLIRGLTEQLQGTLTFTREGGTGVTLRFPV